MTNKTLIKSFFKPFTKKSISIKEYLLRNGISEREYMKITLESECSKSIDESCINLECNHNFFKIHQDELYIDVMQEIQAERKAIKERNERDRKKYGYI